MKLTVSPDEIICPTSYTVDYTLCAICGEGLASRDGHSLSRCLSVQRERIDILERKIRLNTEAIKLLEG
jgi:hypothetical protein